MATPGYPQMGGPMNPMMGPGPMGPPMGAAPMRPVRRGTSRAVPVVVSAGLAIGVFCGLLFGVGTGKDDAAASPSKGNNVKAEKEDEPVKGAAPKGLGATTPNPVASSGSGSAAAKPAAGSGAGSGSAAAGSGSAVAAAGSAAGAGAGSAKGSAAEPTAKAIKLTVQVKPDAAAQGAKIQIDGKDITGTSIDLPAGKKSVKVSVTAPGYHSSDKTVDLQGDETTLEMELVKRGGGGGGGASSPGYGGASNPGGGGNSGGGSSGGGKGTGGGKGSGKKPPGGGGLIDI